MNHQLTRPQALWLALVHAIGEVKDSIWRMSAASYTLIAILAIVAVAVGEGL